jgi:penicillin-binding protein 1A
VAVSPLELTAAYGAFASLGQVDTPRLVLRVRSEAGEVLAEADPPQTRAALDPGVAFLVTSALEDAVRRGTGAAVRAVGFTGAVAGKTGTTNDATDAWFVGYTPEVVASVWMGFDDPRPILGAASGGRLAAPVWGRMMAQAGREGRPAWKPPASVVRLRIDPESGRPLAPGCRTEWDDDAREYFLAAALPPAVCPERPGRSLVDILRGIFGGDDEIPGHDDWPDDVGARSEPAPPREYEEAESARRARREERRRQREWEKEQEERRRDAEEAMREAREASEREYRKWRKEQEKRRKERERRERRRREEDG